MPVWHERTREAREAGELTLIGITEEQHPDRCQLFAQWQRFDWPILWDPFNLTESSAVPVAIGIDEHGIVRAVGMTVEQFEDFMAASYDPSVVGTRSTLPVRKGARGPRVLDAGTVLASEVALSRLLWSRGEGAALSAADYQACIGALERATAQRVAPSALFRLGVARRMRYDSSFAVPEDFQTSLDLWIAALTGNPSQYIWRRRIQQWGPRLDKPYPFYDWIEQASREISARGDQPVDLAVSLTTSEVSGRDPIRRNELEAQHPDPERKVPRDTDQWVAIDVAVVPQTGVGDERNEAREVQVHLTLRPSSKLDVYWGNEAGPTQVWTDEGLKGQVEQQGFTLPMPDIPVSSESRRLDFTVATASVQTLRGTVFYFACEGKQGQCRFLAQDFQIAISKKP